MTHRARRWASLVLLAVAYFVAAQLGLRLASLGNFAFFWPAAGIALAGLLVLGPGAWPAVAVGALASALAAGAPPPSFVGETLANTLEPLIGVWLVRRLGVDPTLGRVRDVALFAGPVVVLTPLLSSFLGPISLSLGGSIPPGSLGLVVPMWGLGDALGLLVVTPAILAARAGRFAVFVERPLEAAVLFALLVVGLLFLFTPWVENSALGHPVSFVIVPALIWAAVRFGFGGATAAILLTSTACAIGTVNGYGPFAHYTEPIPRLLVAQLYLAVHSVVAFLVAAADAERRSAIRLREDFLSAASHELKTPLTPLKVGVQLARQRVAAGQLPTRESLERVERQVDRLSRLIDNLLDVSRLTAGRMKLALEELDLVALARDAVSGLGGTAAQAGCTVEVRNDRPVIGRWDKLRVEQVLVNLLANAFKYAPGRPVEVIVEPGDGVGRVLVRDHGGGIAAADRERIFQRFERGSFAGVGGLGLGLFISREIVEAQGGRITVEAAAGGGATFVVELPVAPPEWLRRGKLPPRSNLLRRFGAFSAGLPRPSRRAAN